MKHVHRMPFGSALLPSGGADFSLWAPAAKCAELLLDGRTVPCHRQEDGWWQVRDPHAIAGSRYQWLIDAALKVPDPASRSNPEGPHAPSTVVDPQDFEWQNLWHGRPWRETVAYEMHIGSFTPEGTFAAAMSRLPDLALLGVTAIELMPVASFAGSFGWGYDGILLYAPNPAYGTPNDLKAFVDAAHEQGLMVFLDVVYNHFGPDGNFLPRYAPQFDSPQHETPWGKAINFDHPGAGTVREFMIQNALYWLEEFQFDGLRLDAVHAMIDDSDPHIVEALTRRVREAHPNRTVHIILENDHNNPRRLGNAADLCEGQWNGDFHHCLHVLMTGERKSYYAEYADDPVGKLARVMTLGFAREGAVEERAERSRRKPASSTISLQNSVNFLQCHDQVGNRAFGERLNALASPEALRLASALLLLSPAVPMLFMGEEQASRRPFLYFSDAKPELREGVRAGRRKEFRDAPDGDRQETRDPPDPCSRVSLSRSVIETHAQLDGGQREALEWTRHLLELRRTEMVPRLTSLKTGAHDARRLGPAGLRLRWRFDGDLILEAVLNLAPAPLTLSDSERAALGPTTLDHPPLLVVGEVADNRLGPWSGRWRWRKRDG